MLKKPHLQCMNGKREQVVEACMNEGSATVGVDGDVFCGHNKGRLGLASAAGACRCACQPTNQQRERHLTTCPIIRL